MALDVNQIKADLAEQERQRAAEQERLIEESKKANLEKLAASELKKRIARIADLEKAKTGLKRQIFDLTEGGKISDEKKLQDAIDGYNKSDELQATLRSEATEISQGKYRISNNKVVPLSSLKKSESPFATPEAKGAGAQVEEVVAKEKPKDKLITDTSLTTTAKNDKTNSKSKTKSKSELEPEPEPEPENKLTKEDILNKYPIIDALFEQDPELRALLDKYLNPKSKMTLDQFKKELGQAQYNFKYADIVKDRLAKKAIFDRLGASATGQSDYEREVARIAAVMDETAINLGATVTKEDLNRLAANIYLAGTEANSLVIERALTPYIKLGISPVTGRPTVGGAAGSNYQTLINTAKANGIKEENLARSLGFTNAEDILRKLAEGEPIGTFQQRLRDIAAYGRSDYVKNLLAQGTDFDVIISPYRNMMADVLEIANAEQISLDDATLSMALGKEEMTLTDFRRALRKDPRWQYTERAREEVSSTALSVLRDFGFQG